jgi:DNA-binding IclR family transcriptional regulator
MADGSAPVGVAALDRAFTVVEALLREGEAMSLAALARQTGFYKSTILRLLASLERFGYAERTRQGRYRVGPTALRLGLAYQHSHRLADHLQPLLEGLVSAGCESASFHVRNDAATRLCIARVDSPHSTLDRVRAGDILPLDRGAAGRVILAFSGAPGAAMEQVRAAGLAVSYGERDPACAGIACPVFDGDGRACGAISLSGPKERFTEASVARMSALLGKAAASLSRTLGAPPPGDRR